MNKAAERMANEHMANERTFLAWIRTGIGIMVFGFVTVKFTLFVNQLPGKLTQDTAVSQNEYSITIGIALVVTGALMILLSYWRYRKDYQLLMKEQYLHSTFLVTLLTVILLVMSIGLIAYLIIASYE